MIPDQFTILETLPKTSTGKTDYQALRGMAFWTDVRDWLGGWPYEPATPAEVTGFCEKALGLVTVKVKGGEANVEYLFVRE